MHAFGRITERLQSCLTAAPLTHDAEEELAKLRPSCDIELKPLGRAETEANKSFSEPSLSLDRSFASAIWASRSNNATMVRITAVSSLEWQIDIATAQP